MRCKNGFCDGGTADMRVIKKINNNVSLCVDSQNREVVAFGKGIGFRKPPYEIGLDQIKRVFYDVDPIYLAMVEQIPEKILKISMQIVDYTRNVLEDPVSSNLVFTLADHLHFAIRRCEEQVSIKLPILYDVEHLFEKETKIGYWALNLLKKELKVYLPKEEAACIALHIINAKQNRQTKSGIKEDDEIIEEITRIIEQYFGLSIDRNQFHYSRFSMHVRYLLQRGKKNEQVENENTALYESLSEMLPEVGHCVEKIDEYLQKELGIQLTKEERLYLIVHTSRLCSKEDSSQQQRDNV